VICHGIPDDRPLADGDILNIDVTLYLDGMHGDTSMMFLVGDVGEDERRLVETTERALYAGIGAVRGGAELREIGRAIEEVARSERLGVSSMPSEGDSTTLDQGRRRGSWRCARRRTRHRRAAGAQVVRRVAAP
jgi:methionyl aminopeptidase